MTHHSKLNQIKISSSLINHKGFFVLKIKLLFNDKNHIFVHKMHFKLKCIRVSELYYGAGNVLFPNTVFSHAYWSIFVNDS